MSQSSQSDVPLLIQQLIKKSISNTQTQQKTYKLCIRILQSSFPSIEEVDIRGKLQQRLHTSQRQQDLEWLIDLCEKLDKVSPTLSQVLQDPRHSIQKVLQIISSLSELNLNEKSFSAPRKFIFAENDGGVFEENTRDLMEDDNSSIPSRSSRPQSIYNDGFASPIVKRTRTGERLGGSQGNIDSPVVKYNNYTQSTSQDTFQTQKYQEYEIQRNSLFEVNEDILLRDVIYSLQGVDGTFVKYNYVTDSYALDKTVACPSATRDMVRKVCELGWLFKRVKNFVDETSSEARRSLALQSFCSAINKQLTEYYKLIAVLESHIKSPSTRNQLSLRRLVVWTMDPSARLRALLQLIEECKNQKGGKLADVVYTFSRVGDPFVASFTTHVLQEVCTPLYNMILSWILDGDLQDPFEEFFIEQEHNVPNEELWHRRYRLRKTMLPSFVSPQLGAKILRIGKSINFLKLCCKDTQWHMDRRLITSSRLNVERVDELESIVDNCAEMVDRRVMEIIFSDTKFAFLRHLGALKQFLLVGQGDFINILLRLVSDELSKPAHNIDRYALPALLDSALKSTNVLNDNEMITSCLRISVDTSSQGSNNAGWDTFKLEYKPLEPISTIFPQETLDAYLQIFQFLWHIKRVERDLNSAWKRQITLTRRISPYPRLQQLSSVLHPCNLLRHEMVYFINNLQYFLMFERIESQWNELLEKTLELKMHGNLDQLIEIHQKFPLKIIQDSFLDEESRPVLDHLRKIFRLVHQFMQIQKMVNHTVLHILQQETIQNETMDSDDDDNKPVINDAKDQKDLQKLIQKLQLSKKQYDLLFAQLLKMKPAKSFVKVFKIKM